MKSLKTVPVFYLLVGFLFIICINTVSGIDPEAILSNDRFQLHVTFMGKTKPWIPRELLPTTQGYAKKYQPNHEVKQHAQNNPYFSDHIGGDSTDKLLKRINRASIKKPDEKPYQDQINAKLIYNRKHKENIEAIFQSLALETNKQVTNIYDSADAKANMEAVFGICTTELEENKKSDRLNTADKSFIDNSTLMDQIADIFGPPPTDSNNLHFKRKIDEKSYQGSLQAAIYNSFGPEVIEPSGTSDEGDSLTLTMEDDGHIADNYELEENKKSDRLNTADKSFIDNSTLMDQIADIFGPPPTDSNNLHFKRKIDEKSYQGSLQAAIYNSFGPEVIEPSGTSDDLHERYPPPSYMEAISRGNHNTSTATQGPSPAESTPESRQSSHNRPGHWLSPSPIPRVVSTPPRTSTSSIASSSTSHDGVDNSTSSTPTAPSRNGASAQKANLMLLNSCLYCLFFMGTLVATVLNL